MNYVMKAIGLFDIHNPNSWKNYTGCLSPYTDPKNPAIVSFFSYLGPPAKASDHRSAKLDKQRGSLDSQNKANPNGLLNRIHLHPHLQAVRQETAMLVL